MEILRMIKGAYLNQRPDPSPVEMVVNAAPGSTLTSLKESEERFRAMRLIQTGDKEAVGLGQAILRILGLRASLEDTELLDLPDR